MAWNKLSLDSRLPAFADDVRARTFLARLYELFREHATAVNKLRFEGTAAPTTGTWSQGDFVWNTAPAEAGSSSSKYVILGWVCTVSGTPGTWLQCRTLTGN